MSALAPTEIVLPEHAVSDLARYATRADWEALDDAIRLARRALAGRTVWVINSTATGGGVAELTRSLVPYCRDAGIDARWLVIQGTPAFFAITKRIHNLLHGHPGDGGPLGAVERATYDEVLAANAWWLRGVIGEGDVVVLHDPQTAGLLPLLAESEPMLVWRCHVGSDQTALIARRAWDFLVPYLRRADRIVVSPGSVLPAVLAAIPTDCIAPSIDPCATKNLGMRRATARAILARAGLTAADGLEPRATFARRDGSRRAIARRASVLRDGAGLRLGSAPLIAHLGRWDRLKDPVGVMQAIVDHVPARLDAHLILAGPDVHAVTDDPEDAGVFAELERAWTALSPARRRRVTIAALPMDDRDENAAIVNALQRQADVVVKKSLQEGFGLGVTEALWKRRPVVATRVGGIREQVLHGRTGLLVDDPTDLDAFGRAVTATVEQPTLARALGRNGHVLVRRRFLSHRHLLEWAETLRSLVADRLDAGGAATRAPVAARRSERRGR